MNEDPARNRFLILQALRLAGIAQVVLGLAITADKVALPHIAGYLLIANGMVDTFLIPVLLARRWKSPLP
jgi:hypothetical protein